MQVEKFTGGPYATNGYVAYDKSDAIVIDIPAHTAKKICDFLQVNKLKLVQIIATHIHWDHIEDAHALNKRTGVRFGVHNLDEQNQLEINSIFEGEAGIIKSDFNIEDGDEISIGSAKLLVIHTPGHTPGSVCLYNQKEKILFSGDTLFNGSYGRVDFPLSSYDDIKESLKKLLLLPSETKVYPGHGLETTIGKEKWMKKM